MEKWFITMKKADFQDISEKFHITPVTARLIRNRDVVGDAAIREYLHGDLKDLHDPFLMKGMREAVSIIRQKIAEHKAIRIIGDYDIDGVCSTYILLTAFQKLGACVDTDIPDRLKDGYGINEQLIQRAYDSGIDTIVTCDNGIAAIDQIAYAKSLGMTVVVTDHHDIPYIEQEDGSREILTSQADVIINPKQQDCAYPFENLCGAAVAYKLSQALYESAGFRREDAYPLLEFAAFATVGDVMDLVGENRILVKIGLRMLQNTQNRGMRALIQVNDLTGKKLTAYHIGFVLGPCINASGRLDTAKRALKLLQAEDTEEAQTLAGDLKALNDSRKYMTLQGVEKAMELIDSTDLKKDKVLLVYLPDCHESLAGIIAGRIREKYHKPVFVLTDSEEGVKGSGRSIEAYSMFEEMTRCRELFTKFGGHPMAAGCSLLPENLERLRKQLNLQTTLTDEDFVEKVSIDVAMPLHYITEQQIRELELLEPFGKGNQKPLFAEKDLKVRGARILGKNKNVLKMQLENTAGQTIDAMLFQEVPAFLQYISEKFGETQMQRMLNGTDSEVNISVTYYPTVNEYNGKRTLQIIIENYR
ncbi:single-stranded-DNA-specific exonuclease RecJ [Diplocloster agilis]|uniref:Single-stranded-DNA-specific exonuclease RecJ n=1 Tax=Diplocloster agilis TaxID=2850323 RepID=A0A949K8Z7_9FIRM|nr:MULTISPECIES: single-stranded-DNA-specific exonuclease RecJ [Lachnospiraceae]MBU9738982.1 single-stranded-DNA-specific exonuclease RecJ [Diplocloster agilis]MCU6735909.1 single-stranded-DNA-specific exonuclease RecJ [Suonthocola fibrivorans]SCJ83992.1 Single-stranded-DNA-specific exonuclease recJ [uncultured Clostridium sp.]